MDSCTSCQTQKPQYQCGLCDCAICKKCRETLSATDIPLMAQIPDVLKHGNYCPKCYADKVVPLLEDYARLAELAEDVFFVTKNYKGYVRIMTKHSKKVAVVDFRDRREAILALAYQAAELGYNAIIQAEIESKKVKIDGYQSTLWAGTALPAKIDGDRLELAALRGF